MDQIGPSLMRGLKAVAHDSRIKKANKYIVNNLVLLSHEIVFILYFLGLMLCDIHWSHIEVHAQ